MIRDGRTERNVGPAPAQVAGLASVNAIALATEVYVAPVERRYLTPVELAAIHEQPVTEEPKPNHHYVLTPEVAQARVARVVRPHYTVVRQPIGRPRLFSDDELFDALRANHGSQMRAAVTLGVSHSGVKRRLRKIRTAGPLPADLQPLMRGPGGWWRAAA